MSDSIRRILFPTDFSEPAKHAQKYAMALADRFGAELHLLHVFPEVILPIPDSPASWTPPEVEINKYAEEANNRLLELLGTQWAEKHRTMRSTRFGYAVDVIIQYAKEYEIDLIVIGTHGRTGLSHLLLGSVAEKLVRLATCPVLTVHPQGHQFLIDDAKERAAPAQT